MSSSALSPQNTSEGSLAILGTGSQGQESHVESESREHVAHNDLGSGYEFRNLLSLGAFGIQARELLSAEALRWWRSSRTLESFGNRGAHGCHRRA